MTLDIRTNPQDLPITDLLEFQCTLYEKLWSFSRQKLRDITLESIYEMYLLDPYIEFDIQAPDLEFFGPWLFFDYPYKYPLLQKGVSTSLGVDFMKEYPNLSHNEKLFVGQACQNAFQFYEVLDLCGDHCVTLQNMITKRTIVAWRDFFSQEVEPYSIIFAKIFKYEDMYVNAGFAPCIFDNNYELGVREFKLVIEKKVGKITDENSYAFRQYFLHLYQDFVIDDMLCDCCCK